MKMQLGEGESLEEQKRKKGTQTGRERETDRVAEGREDIKRRTVDHRHTQELL